MAMAHAWKACGETRRGFESRLHRMYNTYMKKSIELVTILIVIVLIVPKPVYAYIDPGTGSYVFQIILAAIFGGGFAFRSNIKNVFLKIKKVISGKKESSDKID